MTSQTIMFLILSRSFFSYDTSKKKKPAIAFRAYLLEMFLDLTVLFSDFQLNKLLDGFPSRNEQYVLGIRQVVLIPFNPGHCLSYIVFTVCCENLDFHSHRRRVDFFLMVIRYYFLFNSKVLISRCCTFRQIFRSKPIIYNAFLQKNIMNDTESLSY